MYVDDIPSNVKVKVTNTKNNKTKTFTKQDCGKLPNAILDIFEDGKWSAKGICGLTVNGAKDSVDVGKIYVLGITAVPCSNIIGVPWMAAMNLSMYHRRNLLWVQKRKM